MVFLVYFIIVVSFFDTLAQLPLMSPFAKSLGAGEMMTGLIIGMYSLTNLLGNVVAGHFVDRIGRKKIMIWGMIIAGVSVFIYSLVVSPQQLLIIRAIHGIGGALLVPAAFAFLGDSANESTRGQTMAKSGAAIGIAALLGPPITGLIKETIGLNWVFYFISALMLVTATIAKIYLPETLPKKEKKKVSTKSFLKLLNNKQLIFAYIAAFALMFAKGILAYTLPLKVAIIGYSAITTGLLFSSFALAAILIFILPTSKLSDTFGRHKLVFSGLILIAISLAGLSILEQIYILTILMFIYGIGFGLLFPAMTAHVVDLSNKNNRGTAFGLFYAFFSLGVVIGPVSVGLMAGDVQLALLTGAGTLVLIIIILKLINRK